MVVLKVVEVVVVVVGGPGALFGHSAIHIPRYTNTDTSPHSSKSLGSKR